MKHINHRLNVFLQKLPLPSHWKLWFILALLFKSIIFIYKITEPRTAQPYYSGTFACHSYDSSSYIDPIENLLAEGVYEDDYRMPGYGWVYFLLRLIFSQGNALSALVLLQLLLSVISVYVLALLAHHVFKHICYFYLTFFLYLISSYVSLYDYVLLTESFCTSSIIFSVYFLITGYNEKGKLLISGSFLTWAIFLRPIVFPILLIFVVYVFITNRKDNPGLTYKWSRSFVFMIPFLIFDGMWLIRNYCKYEVIAPLTRSIYYSKIEQSFEAPLFHFMNAFGGSIVHWEPGAEITFFVPLSTSIKKKIEVILPSYIYTSKFNYDSLLIVKREIRELRNDSIPEKEKKALTQKVKLQLDSYTASIRQEKPFLYYVSSRFKVFKRFFIHSGTYNLFIKASYELGKAELVVKVFYSLFYLFVLVSGFAGNIWLFIKGFKNVTYQLLMVTGLYFALVFPFVFKLDEYRYFVVGYPFFILASVYTLINGYQFISKKIHNVSDINYTSHL